MTSKIGSARAVTLALERLTQTAIIDGEVVDLPPREFALLSELAARAGTPIHTKKLVPVVWPDTPGMTLQDLYVVISTMRKRIGDHERSEKLVRTERRSGYYLALPPEQVLIADDLDKAYDDQIIRLEPETAEQPEGEIAAPSETAVAARVATPQPDPLPPRRRIPRPALIAVLVLLAVGGSWSAGYLISSQLERNEPVAALPDSDSRGPAAEEETRRPRNESPHKARRKDGSRGNIKKASQRRHQRQSGPTTIAAPPAAPAPQVGSTDSASAPDNGSAQEQPARKPKPQPAPLPAAPTRFLYHLVNQESGDHFVTTDGNVSSQYQARGYEGGAIGRVYTSAVEGTRAISTNQGTAYIFIRSDTKTEPASRTVPLWYSTNNSGDFFYTTNEGEAKQTGWSASVVGYVGAL